MADIRIKDLATTATTTASDDFMAVDGVTNGTRKLSAATPAFLTSVTTPSLTSPAASNLTLATGSFGTALTVASATGKVGIGTTTPSTMLEVAGVIKTTDSTASSTTGNGALVVAGGAGILGAINVGGTGTFGGAVTIGNTVNTVSPTSPNRTVTMVVNGVTLYFAAKTSND